MLIHKMNGPLHGAASIQKAGGGGDFPAIHNYVFE